MNWTDVINGCWEIVGGLAIIPSIRATYKAKAVKGVVWESIAFFMLWGIWNIFFYPMNGHMFSFYGGLFLSATNIVWVALLIKYRNKK